MVTALRRTSNRSAMMRHTASFACPSTGEAVTQTPIALSDFLATLFFADLGVT